MSPILLTRYPPRNTLNKVIITPKILPHSQYQYLRNLFLHKKKLAIIPATTSPNLKKKIKHRINAIFLVEFLEINSLKGARRLSEVLLV